MAIFSAVPVAAQLLGMPSPPQLVQSENLLLLHGVNSHYSPHFSGQDCAARWRNPRLRYGCGLNLKGAAIFDAAISHRNDGSGSLRFDRLGDKSEIFFLPRPAGELFTFSGFMRTTVWPSPHLLVNVRYYDQDRRALQAEDSTAGNDYFVRWANSESGRWQEFSYLFRPPPQAKYMHLIVQLYEWSDGASGTLWLDDLHLAAGVGFAAAATEKTPFDGGRVRVDALGNMELKRADQWQPFFPLCIYADSRRPSYQIYADQGFNCVVRANDVHQLGKAAEAGLMAGLNINWYLRPRDASRYGDPDNEIAGHLKQITRRGLEDHLLWYYWDNENEGTQLWRGIKAVADKIHRTDPDRPIYALQGNEGLARKYHNTAARISDMVGEYVGGEQLGQIASQRGALGHRVLEHIEGQHSPVVMAQLNFGVGEQFRPRLYTAIAQGARGMGYWRDEYPDRAKTGSVTTQPWWGGFPAIAEEIRQLQPLIRQPHWTDWQLSSSASMVEVGARTWRERGYIIAANHAAEAVTTIFSIAGLPYPAAQLRDFFQPDSVIAVVDDRAEVTLAPFATAVFRIEPEAAAATVKDVIDQSPR